MSDDYDNDDDEETDEQPEERPRKRMDVDAADWRTARKKAKAHDAAVKERDDALKQLAIHDAGLTTLNARQRTALLSTHDGELTADALKETAKELGFWSEPDTEETDDDAEAIQRMDAVSAGAGAPGPQSERQRILEKLDPDKLSEDEFWAEARSLGVAK